MSALRGERSKEIGVDLGDDDDDNHEDRVEGDGVELTSLSKSLESHF